ncbi:protein-L-isoaspartate O-methyltransferase [Telmatospirillum sp. J64-1]|uniref:protein-L-isoaspartate O-methyltransferase family protein n=1 Tax=Telmatospirillum sp. J64-1 TaxID=2502183 RepID=UPI00115CF0DB|nr:protein-L-isoaspartate O-methyltransferase [Telmatospirillum sp. J64-1]
MDYAAARHNMVENQIRTNRVTDPLVTDAMEALPRELFVPKQMRGIAYIDEDLPLGNGRFLMEPMVLARLLQMAEIKPTDVVLEIGCATGYCAGVVSKIASTVVALESDDEMSQRANSVLNELGIHNVAVVNGPLREGYPAQAPYDVIVISGAVEEVPPGLCQQLADGGRLVAVVAGPANMGQATLIERVGDAFGRRVFFEAGTPLLPGMEKQQGFVF